jgi:tRNA A-37 threonylcarbamoyl transferase component Bud32
MAQATGDALRIRVDPLDAMACTACRQTIKLDGLKPFSTSACPKCRQEFTVPAKLGGYALLKPLAQGAQTSIFSAFDRTLHRRVIVEVLDSDQTDKELYRRFNLQARALAALTHPNLAKILAIAEEKGQPMIVMDVVPGHRLSSLLKQGQTWDEPQVLAMALGLADGLALAQKMKACHGDINPDNILIAASDGRPVLINFGLDLLHSVQIQQGKVWGDPQYISPEKAKGGESSPHGDMYSLGCVLYRLLAGVTPFNTGDTKQLIRARLAQDAPSITNHRPDLAPATVQLIDSLTRRDPAHRPADYRAVELLIKQAQAGPPDPFAALGGSVDVFAAAPASASPVYAAAPTMAATSHAYRPPVHATRRRRKASKLPLIVGLIMFAGIVTLIILAMQAPGLPTAANSATGSSAGGSGSSGNTTGGSTAGFSGPAGAAVIESFDGPSLGRGWSDLGPAGQFMGGGYVVTDTAAEGKAGVKRDLATGDVQIDISLGTIRLPEGGEGRVGVEIKDDSSHGVMVHVVSEPDRNYLSFEHYSGTRAASIHCQHELDAPPRSLDLKIVWKESAHQWDIHFGVDASSATTPMPAGPILRYPTASKPTRNVTLFADKLAGEGSASVSINSFKVQ